MAPKDKPKIEFDYNAAVAFAIRFANKQRRKFISDDIIKEFYKISEPPKDGRIWGGIMFTLKVEGRIKASGATMQKPCTGGNRKWFTIWVKTSFSEQQRINGNKKLKDNPQINITFDGNG